MKNTKKNTNKTKDKKIIYETCVGKDSLSYFCKGFKTRLEKMNDLMSFCPSNRLKYLRDKKHDLQLLKGGFVGRFLARQNFIAFFKI